MSETYISSYGIWYPVPGSFRMRADLYVDPGDGKPRLRCAGCGKVAYQTMKLAEMSALAIADRKAMRPYRGECGWYHITRKGGEEWLAKRNSVDLPHIILRDYQEASLDALHEYFNLQSGNPIIALPTGTGKSIVIGEFVRRACTTYKGTQILVLTHVKELIEQNLSTLLSIWPTAPAGVYSAGLGRREHDQSITFAGIQSVFRKPELFGHIDLVLVDECHLVSPKSETMYAAFLAALKEVNTKLKVVGFTATPFRLKHGMLTDPGGLFDDVAFDLTERSSFNWLVQQGWLSPPIPRQTNTELDVTGVKITGGEFVMSEVQDRVDQADVTLAALREAVHLADRRNHWLVFASGIAHAEHISEFLNDHFGIPSSVVHSKLATEERDKRIRDFKAGRLRALVNNNILTTGFDYPDIDCIVMLRPTASPGLWVQMLGRGTRPAPGKQNCLVLDFAGNTKRLGPINDPVLPKKPGRGAPGVAPVRLCEHCGCYSHASVRFCENQECGVEFPKNVKITTQASIQEILAGAAPELFTYKVDLVTYRIHKKPERPDSMRVDYYCGLRRFSEYICLDHGGYAYRVARKWWESRCPWGVPPSVHDGMAAIKTLRVPTEITVVEKTKYPEICGYTFKDSNGSRKS